MSSLNRSNKGHVKRKNLSRVGIELPSRLTWCRKLFLLYKVLENENPKYLFSLIPTRRSLYSTRNIHIIPLVNTKQNFFKKSFFPSTVIEWNKLDPHLRKSDTFSVLKAIFLSSYDHLQTLVYNCHNPRGIYLLQDLIFA